MNKQNKAQNQQQAEPVQAKKANQEIQSLETAVAPPTSALQRAYTDPRTLSPADAKILQRTIGNQALGQLIIQRKMTVGPVGDKYEQEADAVAKQVFSKLHTTPNSPAATAQRQEDEQELQMKPLPNISSLQRQEEEELQLKPLVQRQEEEEELQAKGDPMLTGGELSGDVESSVQSAKSGGQPMSDNIRAPMEQAFNADFSGVKVHTGSQPDSLNRSLSARAFTSGQDVFFRQGEYNPGNSGGQELLAHELTHVVQQNGGAVRRKPLSPSPQHSATETISATDGDHAIQAKGDMVGQHHDSSMVQRSNQTGLPDNLKSGVESLSGIALDNVKVHYNSDQPALHSALAYAQGSDIHVAPGQEQHLPHEAWHVVQQAQGRVQSPVQKKEGIKVNDDSNLENEADVMGAKALTTAAQHQGQKEKKFLQGKFNSGGSLVTQLIKTGDVETRITFLNQWLETKLPETVPDQWKTVIRTQFEKEVRDIFTANVKGGKDNDQIYLPLTSRTKDTVIPAYVNAVAALQKYDDSGGDFGTTALKEAKKDLTQAMNTGTDANDIVTKSAAVQKTIEKTGNSLLGRMSEAKGKENQYFILAATPDATDQEKAVHTLLKDSISAAKASEVGVSNPQNTTTQEHIKKLNDYAAITVIATELKATYTADPHNLSSQKANAIFAERHKPYKNKPKTQVTIEAEFKTTLGLLGHKGTAIATMSKTAIAGDNDPNEQAAVTAALAVIGTNTYRVCVNRGGHRNDSGHLPGAPSAINYTEWGIKPPTGIDWPGGRRLVQDTDSGHIYYTWTHYGDHGAPAFVVLKD